MMNQISLERAIELAENGRYQRARDMLRAVLHSNPQNIVAWRWLAYLAPDPGEALTAAYRVLALDADDEWTNRALPELRQRARATEQARHSARQHISAPSESEERLPVYLPVLLLGSGLLLVFAAVFLTAYLWMQLGTADRHAAPPEAGQQMAESITEPAGTTPVVPTASDPQPAEPTMPPTQDGAAATDSKSSPDGEAGLGFTPIIDDSYDTTTYSFSAATEDEIRTAMFTNGPTLTERGVPTVALTSYRLWTSWSAYDRVTCQLTEVTVHLDVTYILPEWIPGEGAAPYLLEEWDRFIAHVEEHEAYHGEIALSCARDLADRIVNSPTFSDCADVSTWLDDAIQEVYTACQAEQQAFDDEEGTTRFPLP